MISRIPLRLEITVRWISRTIVWAIATGAIAIATVMAGPALVGFIPGMPDAHSASVLSGSMSPAVDTGDMTLIVRQDAEDIEIGQIVAFNATDGSGKLLQHRVQYVGESGNTIQVVTKGDANTAGEKWQTTPGETVGKAVLVVPKLGFIIGKITGGEPVALAGRDIPLGSVVVMAILIVAAVVVIIGILRKKPGEPGPTDTDLALFDGAEHFPAVHSHPDEHLPPGAAGPIHQQQEGPTHA